MAKEVKPECVCVIYIDFIQVIRLCLKLIKYFPKFLSFLSDPVEISFYKHAFYSTG